MNISSTVSGISFLYKKGTSLDGPGISWKGQYAFKIQQNP